MNLAADLSPDERALIENVLKPHARSLRRAAVDDVEDIANLIQKAHKAHPDLARIAALETEAETTRIIELRDPITVASVKKTWYSGPRAASGAWADLTKVLNATGKWSPDDIASLDASSTRIVAALPAPGLPGFLSKGLVIGYVQSGKTASYTAVISKAADEGYKLFIVVAGLTDRLRTQTQKRLTKELVEQSPGRWHTITGKDYDFSAQHVDMQAAAMLAANNGQCVLAVVKKNTSRLHRLTQWLSSASAQLKDAPVLIIDDEADEASINTAKQERHRSAINARLYSLIKSFPRVAYVAYTATPFANLLIPAENATAGAFEDLYPSDFIIDLPRPSAYIGAERIFGRSTLPSDGTSMERVEGIDAVRTIPIAEEATLRVPSSADRYTFVPPAVSSLVQAVQWFVLSCAMRRARGEGNEHMTMLIHTSQYTAVHESTRRTASAILQAERQSLSASARSYRNSMRLLWESEQNRILPEAGTNVLAWAEVESHLSDTLASIKIYVENGVAQELNFDSGPTHGIVIGGNVLSRGLTIEGLAVSYFIRTASSYDTLLQMGRWFGFRKGYLDVSRIWMPLTLQRDFADLALVEEEIRTDIKRYALEGLSPTQFAVRIRCHSTLLVTSKLKMRKAVKVSIGYAGREVSTRVFYRTDNTWLHGAWQSGSRLLDRIEAAGKKPHEKKGAVLFRDVEAEKILDFLEEYEVHPDCAEFRREILAAYIRNAINAKSGSLSTWNVAVIQPERPLKSTPKAALGTRVVRLLNRSRVREGAAASNYANIRALTSEGDAGIDLPPELIAQEGSDRATILRLRTANLPNTGLLLLYPIDRLSPAPTRTTNRVALEAAHHVLAASMVFPGQKPTEGFLESDYISADLSAVVEIEPEEESFLETEDGIVVQPK